MKTAAHIADRIRLMIATRQFQVGEVLPSTRDLALQLGVSFHTVRKAYGSLANEGLLRAEKGHGFVVLRESALESKEQRLERGAGMMRKILEELIGYGLDEDEIEMLFEEQLEFAELPGRSDRNVVIAESMELAVLLVKSLRRQVGVLSKALTLDEAERSAGFEMIFCPLSILQTLKRRVEQTPIIPLVVHIDTEVLIALSERIRSASLGVLARDHRSVPIIINQLKNSLQIEGSIIGAAVTEKTVPPAIREADVIVYTPAVSSVVEHRIGSRRRIRLAYSLAERSCEMIRQKLWDD